MAISAGRILLAGTEAAVFATRGPRTEVLEAAAVLPGFVDAHLHFFALARRVLDLDCSVAAAPSLEDLLARLRAEAARRPAGTWIRAFGWDETFLAERRAPTRAELDRAAPGHAVRLLHRTGHAAVLNSEALRRAGLPCGAQASGLVHEPGLLLRGRIPEPPEAELEALAAGASQRLLEHGVTSFHDPSPSTGMAELGRFRRLATSGHVRQRVRLFGGKEICHRGESERAPASDVLVRGRKIVVDETTGAEELAEAVADADARGVAVALHAVEGGPLAAAVAALARLGRDRVHDRRHRIEHASLCPPPLAEAIAACGAVVVAQPAFLTSFADKYRREVEEPGWLYPLRSYLAHGIPLGFGSDAPIAPAEPLRAIAAAVLRSDGAEPIAADEAIDVSQAVRAHTATAAAAGGDEDRLGVLAPGRYADLVLLERDPFDVRAQELGGIRVLATLIGGEIAWDAGR